MVRRIAAVIILVLLFLPLGVLIYGGSSSEVEPVLSVSPVEAETPPEFRPGPAPTDMGDVWTAAVADDPSPDLAPRGNMGTSGGKIALTFDDGPDPRTTPLILDTLREHDINATFFVLGRQVKEHPELLRRIVREGHTIGNHTYDHADMSTLTPDQMRLELQRTQEAVDEAFGYHYRMALMRPPYGEPYFDRSRALGAFKGVVQEEQLFPVIWTLDTQDYLMEGNPQGVISSVVRQSRAGRKKDRDQVVLMHDTHSQSAQALPEIIDHFERSDRKFVGVNELLRDKYLDS